MCWVAGLGASIFAPTGILRLALWRAGVVCCRPFGGRFSHALVPWQNISCTENVLLLAGFYTAPAWRCLVNRSEHRKPSILPAYLAIARGGVMAGWRLHA